MAKTKATHIEEMVVVKQAQPGRAFPLDMLRYDRCVPANETDAHVIEHTIADKGATLKALGWTGIVLLRRFTQLGAGPVNVERWRSYGWSVTATYPPDVAWRAEEDPEIRNRVKPT